MVYKSIYNNQIENIKRELAKKQVVQAIALHNFFNEPFNITNLDYKQQQDKLLYQYEDAELTTEQSKIINNKEFIAFLQKVLSKKIISISARALKFTHKDYTLLSEKTTASTDLIIDCTQEWDEQWGGNPTYVDGTGDFITLPPAYNALMIIQREVTEQQFIKYINHYAGRQKRYVILAEIQYA